MKKILLLGGSAQQTVAIRAAKKLGYFTIVCDYLPDNPGQYIADRFYGASTTDVEAIYEIARKEGVDGILAYASDPAALPAAIVAERLGLPTNPAKSVEILGLKHPWRQFLQKNGFACPKVYTFHPNTPISEIQDHSDHFSFPLVVKPTDSSGSKGVTMLNNWSGLEDAVRRADSFSRNKILLIEEYIQRGFPSIIGGDIFVWNGAIVLYGEMDKVHFLELGPRAGGNMIPIQLSDIWGIDLVRANVQAAMGETPEFIGTRLKALPGCHMHYVLHSYEAGRFQNIDIDDSIRRFVYREVIYKKEGDTVEVFDGAGKALGILFLHFDTPEEMEHFCKNHNSLINIVLQK